MLLGACATSSEVIVFIDTDAPVPPAATELPDPNRPPWLFDRLRIEVLRSGQLVDESALRDFAVDEQQFRDGKVSMGVAPVPGEDELSVRVRLYRSGRLLLNQPRASSTLDTTAALPSVGTTNRAHVTVRLHVEDIGTSIGPIAPDLGDPGPSAVGSWPGAKILPCPSAAGPGEVCVPGGAYFMGDPLLGDLDQGRNADNERLVVISPFWLDTHEATVAEYRAQQPNLVSFPPDHPNTPGDITDVLSWCTWTDAPGANEAMPLNCILRTTALEYCQSLGKSLPTEAQFEFVASGRGRERGHVWGEDDPSCDDAMWGRGGVGAYIEVAAMCLQPGTMGGAAPAGSGLRDRLVIDGVEVIDLAGNLAEWQGDQWSRQDEAYWSRPGVFRDPLANVVSSDGDDMWTQRGGYWTGLPLPLRAAWRDRAGGMDIGPDAGFRCARVP
jgi:formylglycine-generating enzyme required for sulfatase activity